MSCKTDVRIMRSAFLLLLPLGLLGSGALASGNVACKDEQGNDVDWWYMYKLPINYNVEEDNEAKADTSGQRYFYVTSDAYDDWKLSAMHIGNANSLTARTLQPIYDDQRLLLAAYNDEFPNGTVSANRGHAKGVVASDGESGIWLVHSVPKFPTIPHYEYPATATRYAQSLLCLTLDAANVDKVGEVLVYNEPHFYYERLPFLLTATGDGEKFPSLQRALRGQWRTVEPFNKIVELSTLGGKKFKAFGKSARAQAELYADYVAPTLDVNLLVETWRHGAGNLPPSCQKDDKVFNVAEIKDADLHVAFSNMNDHSKWAVSQETGLKLYRWRIGGADWTCIGDINRQEHQSMRGGGTVCLKSSRIAQLYRKLIANYDKCT